MSRKTARKYLIAFVAGLSCFAIGVAAAQLVNLGGAGNLQTKGGINLALSAVSGMPNGTGSPTCTATQTGPTSWNIAFGNAGVGSKCESRMTITNTGTYVAQPGAGSVGGAAAGFLTLETISLANIAAGASDDITLSVEVTSDPGEAANLGFTLTMPYTAIAP